MAIAILSAPTTIQTGQTITITWTTTDDSTPVVITLRKGPTNNLAIIETITSSGTANSYTWSVPTTLAAGTDYAFGVQQGTDTNFSPPLSLTNSNTSPASAISSLASAAPAATSEVSSVAQVTSNPAAASSLTSRSSSSSTVSSITSTTTGGAGQTTSVPQSNTGGSNSGHKKSNVAGIAAGSAVGAIALIAMIILLIFCLKKRAKRKQSAIGTGVPDPIAGTYEKGIDGYPESPGNTIAGELGGNPVGLGSLKHLDNDEPALLENTEMRPELSGAPIPRELSGSAKWPYELPVNRSTNSVHAVPPPTMPSMVYPDPQSASVELSSPSPQQAPASLAYQDTARSGPVYDHDMAYHNTGGAYESPVSTTVYSPTSTMQDPFPDHNVNAAPTSHPNTMGSPSSPESSTTDARVRELEEEMARVQDRKRRLLEIQQAEEQEERLQREIASLRSR